MFALHPLHVESVAWFAQRKDVLCGFFWLVALFVHLGGGAPPSLRRRAAVWTLGALALLAKPVAVTLPFALVLVDFWPGQRIALNDRSRPDLADLARSVRRQWPLFVAAAAISFVTYQVQAQTGAVATADALPFGTRLTNAILAIGAYSLDVFWPRDLAVFYPHPRGALPLGTTFGLVGLILAITALVVARARRWPWAIVGWCWFLGTLVPMLGLVQVGEQARADRYMYIPLIGLAWVVAFGAARAVRGRPGASRALAALGAASLLALGFAARAQVATWRTSTTLYAQAIAATGTNAFAERGLGRALRREGRGAQAHVHLQQAVRLRPNHAATRVELAELLAELGQRDAAIVQYGAALERDPNDLRSHINRGQLLVRTGRYEEAVQHLEFAQTRVQAGQSLAAAFRRTLHLGLARAYAAQARPSQAEDQLRAAREVDPEHPAAWILTGELALQRGDAGAAAKSFRAAADRADARGEAALASSLRARARQLGSETSSSTDSSPGTPTRSGNP